MTLPWLLSALLLPLVMILMASVSALSRRVKRLERAKADTDGAVLDELNAVLFRKVDRLKERLDRLDATTDEIDRLKVQFEVLRSAGSESFESLKAVCVGLAREIDQLKEQTERHGKRLDDCRGGLGMLHTRLDRIERPAPRLNPANEHND